MESNAVCNPWAMVVEPQYTSFTHFAMVRAVGFERSAHLAESFFLGKKPFYQLLRSQMSLISELGFVLLDFLCDDFLFLILLFRLFPYLLILVNKEVISGYTSCISLINLLETNPHHTE